jgi:UDP-N-acetylglucosamine 4,6-dehydratase
MKITDLAGAIAPECRQEVVGIRPGEKIHETLIGEDEGRNTLEYNDCYVIRQNPFTRDADVSLNNGGRPCPDGFHYCSDQNPDLLTITALKDVLSGIEDDYSIEKSRWSMSDVPR